MNRHKIKRTFLSSIVVSLLLYPSVTLGAQDFLTPMQYFEQVSEKFGKIKDYQADIEIDQDEGELVMSGSILYKSPNMLRIDFEEPREQVLSMDGKMITIYIPKYSYVLEQKLKWKSDEATALMASNQQLSYLKDNFSVAYLIGPDPVPLDVESDEMVIKLKFQSLSSSEGFRQLEIAFAESGMIRRVKGKMVNKTIAMDFTNIRLNQNVPDARFEYKAPANANVFKNFLFEVIE